MTLRKKLRLWFSRLLAPNANCEFGDMPDIIKAHPSAKPARFAYGTFDDMGKFIRVKKSPS